MKEEQILREIPLFIEAERIEANTNVQIIKNMFLLFCDTVLYIDERESKKNINKRNIWKCQGLTE